MLSCGCCCNYIVHIYSSFVLQTRSFGCPSIRSDLPASRIKSRRSIADSQNYGDDSTARDLISPAPFSDLSITPAAFVEGKPKEYLIKLFSNIGYSVPPEVSDIIFEVSSGGRGLASVHDYRTVLNEYILAYESNRDDIWIQTRGRK